MIIVQTTDGVRVADNVGDGFPDVDTAEAEASRRNRQAEKLDLKVRYTVNEDGKKLGKS